MICKHCKGTGKKIVDTGVGIPGEKYCPYCKGEGSIKSGNPKQDSGKTGKGYFEVDYFQSNESK